MTFEEWFKAHGFFSGVDLDQLNEVQRASVVDYVLTLEYAWESGHMYGYEDCMEEKPGGPKRGSRIRS